MLENKRFFRYYCEPFFIDFSYEISRKQFFRSGSFSGFIFRETCGSTPEAKAHIGLFVIRCCFGTARQVFGTFSTGGIFTSTVRSM
jgi:hypothetical protein